MKKTLIKELKTGVYLIEGENEKGAYKFVVYEMILPNGIKVNVSDTKNTTELAKAHKILFEQEIKENY